MNELSCRLSSARSSIGTPQFLYLNEAVSICICGGLASRAVESLAAIPGNSDLMSTDTFTDNDHPIDVMLRYSQSSRYHYVLASHPPIAREVFRVLRTLAAIDTTVPSDKDPWASLPMLDSACPPRIDCRRVLNQIECVRFLSYAHRSRVTPNDLMERAMDLYQSQRHCIIGGLMLCAVMTVYRVCGIPVREEASWWRTLMRDIMRDGRAC